MPQSSSFFERTLPRIRPLLSFKWYRMRKKFKDIIPRKTTPTRTSRPMNTIVLILVGILIIAALTFLVSLFRLSLEDADFWLKVISGVLAAFTFLAGAAALVTGAILGNQQVEKIAVIEQAAEEARAKTAAAELALEQLRQRQEPRHINPNALQAFLKGKRKATAVIQYQKNDPEAYNFAMNLWFALHDEAEWDIQFLPSPIRDSVDPFFSQFPSVLAAGGMRGVTIVTKEIKPFPANGEASPYAALVKVLMASGVEVSAAIDVSQADDSFRIIVGPKP